MAKPAGGDDVRLSDGLDTYHNKYIKIKLTNQLKSLQQYDEYDLALVVLYRFSALKNENKANPVKRIKDDQNSLVNITKQSVFRFNIKVQHLLICKGT